MVPVTEATRDRPPAPPPPPLRTRPAAPLTEAEDEATRSDSVTVFGLLKSSAQPDDHPSSGASQSPRGSLRTAVTGREFEERGRMGEGDCGCGCDCGVRAAEEGRDSGLDAANSDEAD